MSKNKKKILNLFFILLVGGLGGILADQLLLPYLATVSPFSEIDFIKKAADGTVIINQTEEIIITENTALENAVDKINTSLTAVESVKNGQVVSQGSGFFITSDGLIITSSKAALKEADSYQVYHNGDVYNGRLVNRSVKEKLALIRVEESNLPVVIWADLAVLRLGQRVVLAGLEIEKDNTCPILPEEELAENCVLSPFVNIGSVRQIDIGKGKLIINIDKEDILMDGAPLINIKGEVLGLVSVGKNDSIEILPVSKIRKFVDL